MGLLMDAHANSSEPAAFCLKRLSELDVLRGRDEDAQPASKNDGRGLYAMIERKNAANIKEVRQNLDQYKLDAEANSRKFQDDLDRYLKELAAGHVAQKPVAPALDAPPQIGDAEKIPDDMSGFVDFLHPWGGHQIDLGLLAFMFFGLLGATTLVLRSQDIA